MIKSKKRIMSYPFTGFDYRQIVAVGKRVRIVPNSEGFDVNYIIPFNDSEFGSKRENVVVVKDDIIKNTLCYFSFLSSMCRYNSELPIFKAIDQGLLSYNTYIDSILICVNEMISGCKYNGVKPDYEEILNRFGKQYNPDDLNRLYSSSSDYKYLDGLFSHLYDDSYCVHTSRYKEDGIYFDKMSDGNINDVVRDIIVNRNSVDYFSSSKDVVCGPKLTKKISKYQVM